MNHQSLPLVDISLIIIYLLGMIAVGYHFSKKNQNAEQFTKASGSIPGWAIGASIYATFLSSNTFWAFRVRLIQAIGMLLYLVCLCLWLLG
jgi:SSS family solute:Na+ symporter